MDSDGDEWSLDCLPFDCIVCICEYLPPEDLSKFSRVCKLFQEASLIGYLWRRLCLSRWLFCDVHQIADGPHRWRRYFLARRKVEARLDTGRPGRDYKVKTLRGHEKDITNAVVIGGGQVNWENPKPPLVISLDSMGSVKAWDVLQAKAVWSLDGEPAVSIAANSASLELAVGKANGTITIWDTQTWNIKATLRSAVGGSIVTLKYVTTKLSSSPQTVLLAHSQSSDFLNPNSQLEVWDTGAAIEAQQSADSATIEATKPLYVLWAPSHSCHMMQTSSLHLLAVPGRIGDVHVWDMAALSSIKTPPPFSPSVTINTMEAVSAMVWVGPGILATTCSNGWSPASVELWDVAWHLEKIKKSGRFVYDDTNMHSPLRTISLANAPLSSMSAVNGLIIAGGSDGIVSVLDPSEKAAATGSCLQKFSDHKGAVTDIYADSFRVLTCSTDFSIRVYRWANIQSGPVVAGAAASKAHAQLESKYTLLGGSVALKTHDGFNKLLCESGSCVGVAGNQLKFYTFSCKLD